MMRDLYRDIVDRYDLFEKFGKYDCSYVRFFRTLFRKNNVKSILDCACGTGHDLHVFHTFGCECTGSDISSSMIAQARKNLQKWNIKIPLYRLDYRFLRNRFKRRFDCVVCLSSSILHMPNKRDVVRAFKSMRGVLREKGILVLTQGTTDKQWKEKPRFLIAGQQKNITRLFVIDYIKMGARYTIVDIFKNNKKENLKVWSTEYAQMLLRDDYALLLKKAGFRKINFYGSFKYQPYSKKTSNRLIIVARK